jgi:uncharacterized membrane protein YhaH (DUF805 family)
MASSIIEDIAAFEEQHRYGYLTDLEFAAAVAGVLPARTDDAVRHPAWLTAVATEVAQLDAEWKRAQSDQHAIPVRGGRILPSRWLAAAFCASSVVGIPLFAFFFWPALTTLSDRFREAGWQAWAALVALVLIPAALFPALVFWWAIEFERAEADFRRRRAAIILGALRRRTEGAEAICRPPSQEA